MKADIKDLRQIKARTRVSLHCSAVSAVCSFIKLGDSHLETTVHGNKSAAGGLTNNEAANATL